MNIKKISKLLLISVGILSMAGCSTSTTASQSASQNIDEPSIATSTVLPTADTSSVLPSFTSDTTNLPSSIVTPSASSSLAPVTPSSSSQAAVTPSASSSAAVVTPSSSSTQAAPVASSSSSTAVEEGINILNSVGANETAYVEFECATTDTAANYKVSYSSDGTNYTQIDNELIMLNGTSGKAYILGLKAGTYSVKVEKGAKNAIVSNIAVNSQDRSGYAHYNYNAGVGAYKDNGQLKDNAVVVYVSNATKNTVKATIAGTEYTGLSAIIQAQINSEVPLNIRILDEIQAATWKKLTVSKYSSATTSTVIGANNQGLQLQSYTEEEIVAGGFNTLDESKYTKLNGLTNKIKYDDSKGEFDSYYNMLDVPDCKNITIEGVGENAGLFQWGFTFRRCTGIEVKNLTFKDTPEDACSAEASDDSTTLDGFTTGHIWIHNNTFYKGKNYWDVCSEQDKGDGDGTVDFKKLANVTVSYNHFIQNHKTGLVGGSDTQHTANLTFHHNFYDNCQSRLPFARQANMHMYNNYYYKSSGSNMQIYAGAYAFIENCYFENVKSTFSLKTSDGKAPAVKSYNNTFDNCSSDGATIVTSRTAAVANDNLYDSSFDTDETLFYYDSVNEKSNVSILNATEDVPDMVREFAGAGANYYNQIAFDAAAPEVTKYKVTFMNGDTTFKTVTVKEGNQVVVPSTYPSKTNAQFECWVDSNGDEYNFSTPVTADITLYAKYKELPSYESLVANTNRVLNYDFNNQTAGTKLTQLPDYNTKGVYGNTNGTDYTLCYAKYTGTGVQTVDNDASAGAQIIVNAGETYTSGTVKGWAQITLGSNIGTKWGILQFYSGETRVLQIGSTDNTNKVWGYTLDGSAFTDFDQSLTFASGTYNIYYELNLTDGTVTILINDKTYLNNVNLGVNSFSSILTMTNGKGTGDSARVVTLDNVAIVKEN